MYFKHPLHNLQWSAEETWTTGEEKKEQKKVSTADHTSQRLRNARAYQGQEYVPGRVADLSVSKEGEGVCSVQMNISQTESADVRGN